MNKKLFLFLVFGCLGITVEIFYTAIYDFIELFQLEGSLNWRLNGMSYIWMFPIYGSAGLILPIVLPPLLRLPLAARLFIYGISILAIEFLCGWTLETSTGVCPWKYYKGYHIMGFIRLDYFPLWTLFGLLLEKTFLFFDRLNIKNELQ